MVAAAAMLMCHSYKHQTVATTPHIRRAPKVDRPLLKLDIPEEEWNAFIAKWVRFKSSWEIADTGRVTQLVECCEDKLRDLLLKERPEANTDTEESVLTSLKALAVIRTAECVRRAKLMASRQEHGQSVRDFHANTHASAVPCNYHIKCPHACCSLKANIDYTPKWLGTSS